MMTRGDDDDDLVIRGVVICHQPPTTPLSDYESRGNAFYVRTAFSIFLFVFEVTPASQVMN